MGGLSQLLKYVLVIGLAAGLAACATDAGLEDTSDSADTVLTSDGGGIGQAALGSQEDFVVNVGDRVFFETDGSNLMADGRSTLARQAAWLKLYPHIRLIVEGHADERGTREYNIALGARRAMAVRAYLVSLGIDPKRLRTLSYGKERPVALCSAENCWSQNRRAISVAVGAAGS